MSRLLLIPDIHQDLTFLSRILDREKLDRFDQIILMGDYFDARSEAFEGEMATRMTARFLLELVRQYRRKVRLLWGNHDIIYCRLREYVLRVGAEGIAREVEDPELRETFQRTLWINESWPGEMWARFEMAVKADGWLISHAGIHPDFWPANPDPDNALSQLRDQWDSVIGDLFENEDHPLLEAGQARGGALPAGGPVWCDWDEEFVDGIPFPQIVGHTPAPAPRSHARSWCIDCAQSAYGVVEEGELVVLNLEGKVIGGSGEG